MSWNNKTPWPQIRFIFAGIQYRWSGFFGCQLESLEWRTVPAGTTRKLDFGIGKPTVEMTVFTTERKGLKVRTTWSVCNSGTHDEHLARIRALKDALASLV